MHLAQIVKEKWEGAWRIIFTESRP